MRKFPGIALLAALFLSSFSVQAELVFGAPPRKSRQDADALYQPIVNYLSATVGEKVVFHYTPSWTSYQNAMRRNAYDILFDGPVFTGWRTAEIGWTPLARIPGHHAFVVFVRKPETAVKHLTTVDVETFCGLPPPHLATLVAQNEFSKHGLQPTLVAVAAFSTVYHDVATGICDAGVMPARLFKRMNRRSGTARILFRSTALPGSAFSAGPRVTVSMRRRLARALLSAQGGAATRQLRARFGADRLEPATAAEYAGLGTLLQGALTETAYVNNAPVETITLQASVKHRYAAATQGVIPGRLFKYQPLLRPGEALESVPGMVVTQHSGDGKANQYFLRGFNLDHGTDFAFSVDGVPVNMPTNAHGQGYSDLNFLIPELIRKIDYRKGPYSAKQGDFSSAGSADIYYRKSLNHDIADITAGGFGYQRALFAGSAHLGGSAPGQFTGFGGSNLLGAIEIMHDNGPWTVPEGYNKLNGLLRWSRGNRESGESVDAISYNAHWNSTDQVPLSLIQSGQLGRYSPMDPTDGGDTGRQVLSGEWHHSDGRGFTRASMYAEHYRLQLWSNFTFYELRPATGDQFEQAENRNLFGGHVARGWTHTLFGHHSVSEIGLQVRHDNIDVSLQNTQARVPFQVVSNDVVDESETGLYFQNTTRWIRWFRTVAGLRQDYISMNMVSRVLPQNSGSASATNLLPKFSAIFGPWDRTEFYLDAGEGFHSNDARGVIDKIDPTTGLPTSPVPPLVNSTGEEIGVRTAFHGLKSSLAVWRLNSDSELIYNADSTIGSTSPNGATRRYGVEWSNHWIINPSVLLDADLSWTHARYANMNENGATGDLIPNAISKVASLGLTLRHLGPWSAGFVARYFGPYPLTQDGSLTAPSAAIANLGLQRRLGRHVAVSVEILNLFNRQYYDIAYGQDYQVSPTSPVVPNGITVHPGEPRQVRVTLKMSF